ncbi:hypothetical protein J3F83DRAFT_720088 [Trichoderma novae-zelandiae]
MQSRTCSVMLIHAILGASSRECTILCPQPNLPTMGVPKTRRQPDCLADGAGGGSARWVKLHFGFVAEWLGCVSWQTEIKSCEEVVVVVVVAHRQPGNQDKNHIEQIQMPQALVQVAGCMQKATLLELLSSLSLVLHPSMAELNVAQRLPLGAVSYEQVGGRLDETHQSPSTADGRVLELKEEHSSRAPRGGGCWKGGEETQKHHATGSWLTDTNDGWCGRHFPCLVCHSHRWPSDVIGAGLILRQRSNNNQQALGGVPVKGGRVQVTCSW